MAQADDFVERLDALEDRRRRAERRLAARLEGAHELVQELAGRAEAAAEQRRRLRRALPDEGIAGEGERDEAVGVREPSADPEVGPPPELRGGTGGPLRRLGRWLLRPWLRRRTEEEQLRRLAAGIREARRRRRTALEVLGRRQAALRRAADSRSRQRAEGFSWIVASSQHAVEALAAAMGVHEAVVGLADARGAETVHRVTRPLDAELEASFGELGRRQESLLAELVGLRRRLDDLRRAAGADAASSPQPPRQGSDEAQ